jgi:hypothetical protein
MREVGWPPCALAKSPPPEGRSATFDLPSRGRLEAQRQYTLTRLLRSHPLPTGEGSPVVEAVA